MILESIDRANEDFANRSYIPSPLANSLLKSITLIILVGNLLIVDKRLGDAALINYLLKGGPETIPEEWSRPLERYVEEDDVQMQQLAAWMTPNNRATSDNGGSGQQDINFSLFH